MPFLDKAFPILREKLVTAARENPQFNFIDFSMLLNDEDVFQDVVHFYSLGENSMPGNIILGQRMAEEMFKIMLEKGIEFKI